jgi:hypothetical protein
MPGATRVVRCCVACLHALLRLGGQHGGSARVSCCCTGLFQQGVDGTWGNSETPHNPTARTPPLTPPPTPKKSQEFNLEKLQLLEQEKAKIRKDYERRESQVDVKKKM